MKYVKMLGLAAVAAAALMAFVGASSASATVLCKTSTGGAPTCPEGWGYPAGTVIHAVNEGNAILTDGNGNVVIICGESTVEGKTENEGSKTETVRGPIEKLTWGSCTNSTGQACTVDTVKTGTLEVHWIEGTNNGTLTSNGATITTLCPSIFGNIHCLYVTENTDLQTLTGGNPATLDVETAPIPQEPTSALCPEKARWDAKYEVTSPKPLYVANET